MAYRRLVLGSLLILLLPTVLSALGLEAITLEYAEAWTGNGYVPTPADPGGTYDFDVTGSETVPIDGFLGAGVRLGLLDGLLVNNAVMSFMPQIQIGARRYVLFESGRVAPAPVETGYGAEGDTVGRGSARVLTIRVPLAIGYEIRFGSSTMFMSLSPTPVFRIIAGQTEIRDSDTDLSGMYAFFYGNMRFLMPEIALGYRFAPSDSLEATIRARYGVSVLDLFDTSLPWYDQMRASIAVSIGLTPPFGGLFRKRNDPLPPGVEPFPGETTTQDQTTSDGPPSGSSDPASN